MGDPYDPYLSYLKRGSRTPPRCFLRARCSLPSIPYALYLPCTLLDLHRDHGDHRDSIGHHWRIGRPIWRMVGIYIGRHETCLLGIPCAAPRQVTESRDCSDSRQVYM